MKNIAFLLALFAGLAHGQAFRDGPPLTAGGQSGITLPATCTIGRLFFDTDATAGQNLYGCTSANTWTAQSPNLAAPGAIGGTTPAAITGTTITATTAFVGGTGSFSTVAATSNINTSSGAIYVQANSVSAPTSWGYVIGSTNSIGKNTWSQRWSSTASGEGSVDLVVSRYAEKQLLISGDGTGATTNAGLILGYYGSTGTSGIWSSTVVPSSTNFSLYTDGANTFINGLASTGSVTLSIGSAPRLVIASTAGAGPAIAAGTATTDVAALSLTRTNNNAAVATGVKWTFTDTSSAAGFLPFQILGGASGTTNLLSVGKTGAVVLGGSITASGTSVFGDAVSNGEIDLKETTLNRTLFFRATGSIAQNIAAGRAIVWSSSDTDANFGVDTSASRISAGLIGVGTGAAGSTAGGLMMSTAQISPVSTALTLTAGAVGLGKMTASASAPGATGGKLELVCGTNAGSAKLVIAAGTSATTVTVVDNIGSGVTGC